MEDFEQEIRTLFLQETEKSLQDGVVHHSASSYVFTNIFMKLSQVSGAQQLLERI